MCCSAPTKVIAELEQKRAHIESSLAELRIINDNVRKSLGLPRGS